MNKRKARSVKRVLFFLFSYVNRISFKISSFFAIRVSFKNRSIKIEKKKKIFFFNSKNFVWFVGLLIFEINSLQMSDKSLVVNKNTFVVVVVVDC
jgi:hypothetical protein